MGRISLRGIDEMSYKGRSSTVFFNLFISKMIYKMPLPT